MGSIEYYQSEVGKFPVAEFIESLDAKSRAKIARTIDLLEEFGIALGMPYGGHLEKQLWELRTRHGRNRYRITYFLATLAPLSCCMDSLRRRDRYPERTSKWLNAGETIIYRGGGRVYELERT